jgi:hypothetical protein
VIVEIQPGSKAGLSLNQEAAMSVTYALEHNDLSHRTRAIFRDTDGVVPVYRQRDNARNAVEALNRSYLNLEYAYVPVGPAMVGPFRVAD